MTDIPVWMMPKKRAVLNEVLSRKPDKPLYHYTTQKGLLGIIKDRQIWATHTQYLNDRREFLHAVDLVREEINRLLDEAQAHYPPGLRPYSARTKALATMQGALSLSPQSINVCVCSFSEERDSLSQWRAYGGGSGFAVGFSGQALRAATEKQQWFLAPCIYDPAAQRSLVRALVEEVLEEHLDGSLSEDQKEDSLLKAVGGNLLPYLNRYAPILKDESFKEEREWRIISPPLFSQHLDYREGRSVIVPYYKLPLCEDNQHLELHGVVIGPTPDGDRSKSSLISLLVSHKVGMPRSGVSLSQVPYRDW
jgi:Protein of unknown function (DUF2971)